ncbi:MAG: L,D-transpeptidase family protein [Sulfurimonas sp.]|nr:L,D-transpeptidase family protein [Sulfurimonas sp.]MDD5201705.1 L,D-transpeptidase family protein [Sulfurimonas sp.]
MSVSIMPQRSRATLAENHLCKHQDLLQKSDLLMGLKSPAQSLAFYQQHCKNKNTFVWFDGSLRLHESAHELIEEIQNSYEHGLSPKRYHSKEIEKNIIKIAQNTFTNPQEKIKIYNRLDLLLSDAYLTLAYELYYGFTNWEAFEKGTTDAKFEWERTQKSALNPVPYLLKNLKQNSIADSLKILNPDFSEYKRLKEALRFYRKLEAKGGWNAIPFGPPIGIDQRDTRVIEIKKRLFLSADLEEMSYPENVVYDEAPVIKAIKSLQQRYNLKPDGLIGTKTISALNIPPSVIIKKIILNMERFRWLGRGLEKSEGYIDINIPAFRMRVYEHAQEVMQMPVIVGKKERATPILSSYLSYAVLRPTWTAPQTIVKEDILANGNMQEYLQNHNMKVFTMQEGAKVDVNPDEVEWADYAQKEYVPFLFRADAGKSNPLGGVKFMFNNKYSIYMHDTNQPALFGSHSRAFSSGCIRLHAPMKLLKYLLEDDAASTLLAQEELPDQVVQIKKKLPILIRYMSVEVDEENKIHLFEDVYGYDARHILALKNMPELGF